MKNSSIERSLSGWLALQTFLALSVACVTIYTLMALSIGSKQKEEFQEHDIMVRHAIEDGGEQKSVDGTQRKFADTFSSHPNFAIEVQLNGETIYSQVPESMQRTRWLWQDGPVDVGLTIDGVPVRTRSALNVASDDALKRQLAWTLLAAALFGSLLVSLSGALLVRLGLAPLRQLATDTGAAGPTQPGLRVQAPAYADELQPWITQFNALLQRADTAYGQLEKFNADLAQELRAPLTAMVAQIEAALRSRSSLESLQDALGSCLESVQQMSYIMNDMLFLAQAERGAMARRTEPVSLADLLQSVAEFHEPELDDRGLIYAIQGDAKMALDQPLARRALSNLMGKSLRAAEPNAVITCLVEEVVCGVTITMEIRSSADAAVRTGAYRAATGYRTDGWTRDHGAAIVSAIARMHGGFAFASSAAAVTRTGLFLAHEATPAWRAIQS